MVITIVTDVLGAENNGTTITAKRLIENLKKRGHAVKVVSPWETDEPGYYGVGKRNFWIFNKYVAKNGVVLAKVNKKMLREAMTGSDVVHIILPFQLGIAAEQVAKELNIPTTSGYHCQAENVTSHFGLQNVEFINHFIYRRFYRKFYKHQNFVHCPSQFIAEELRKNGYGMDLRIISNGVAEDFHEKTVFKPQGLEDKYIILSIGRLVHEKRHDILIDAIKLSKHEKDIQLIIAGLGPLEKQIRQRGKSLINPPIIGFHSKNDLVDIINYADIYVHPSDIEIESIACIEVITCGLVPIISDSRKSAANSFALLEENLFKAGSPSDLAKKIDYLIDHPEIKQIIQKKYLDYAKPFQMKICVDKMEKMFKDAVAKQNGQAL